MGSGRKQAIEPDLFSGQQSRDTSSPSENEAKTPLYTDEPANAAPSYSLPTNLPSTLRHLDDGQLDRLLAAAHAERQARGGKKLAKSAESSRKQQTKVVAPPPLAQGKLNAVRAAFKAGVTPSRIARQFGVSLSDVRKALAGDEKKK
jgi:hypothetical protein